MQLLGLGEHAADLPVGIIDRLEQVLRILDETVEQPKRNSGAAGPKDTADLIQHGSQLGGERASAAPIDELLDVHRLVHSRGDPIEHHLVRVAG
jgi:hypothetical protein